MLDKILRISGVFTLYFCTSLLFAFALLGTYLMFAWKIDSTKMNRMLALAQGYDVMEHERRVQEEVEKRIADLTSEQVLNLRAERLRNEEFMRDQNSGGSEIIISEGRKIGDEIKELTTQRRNFEQRLIDLKKQAEEAGFQSETQMIAKMNPELAKQALLKILKMTGGVERVIMMFRGMDVSDRRKIIAKFQEEPELDELVKVLQKIGDGEPEATLIDDAKKALPATNQ
ncbi:MAG: hypothetical protein LBU65_02985 [Planctomycetaceae bacterium]|nr:hypothetical protein [Planctomycetaceae bacterium]